MPTLELLADVAILKERAEHAEARLASLEVNLETADRAVARNLVLETRLAGATRLLALQAAGHRRLCACEICVFVLDSARPAERN